MSTRTHVLAALALIIGCGCSQTARHSSSPLPENDQPEPTGETEVVAASDTAPNPPSSVDSIVARVLEAGPTGSGRCHQRSYRVERVDPPEGDSFWVHFEHCESEEPPSFDGTGLSIGETYQLRLARGTSESFSDELMIVGVETE